MASKEIAEAERETANATAKVRDAYIAGVRAEAQTTEEAEDKQDEAMIRQTAGGSAHHVVIAAEETIQVSRASRKKVREELEAAEEFLVLPNGVGTNVVGKVA